MMNEVKKTNRHKGRFKLSLPVASTQIKPPLVLFEGVGAGDGLGAGSLILISDDLLVCTFWGFFF
jgi:hypothetical protein